MLSLIDLLDAQSLGLTQAAWLVQQIEQGSSWLVGAKPGGAGKTTIMGALLCMLPDAPCIRLAAPGTGWKKSKPGECIVAYEISPGHYEAYIWGRELTEFTRLGQAGCRIVSNLHADTLEQARAQIVGQNGAAEQALAAFDIFLPIAANRKIENIFYSDGGRWREFDGRLLSRGEQIAAFLRDCQQKGIRRIEEVRRVWLLASLS